MLEGFRSSVAGISSSVESSSDFSDDSSLTDIKSFSVVVFACNFTVFV